MLAAAAVAGILGAHGIDYALLIPDPQHRHDLLMRTGHGYLQFGAAIVAIAVLAALASAVALGAGRGSRTARPGMLMGTVQAGGFVMLEAVERIGAGARFDRSVIAVIALGVALQFLVAAIASRVLRLAVRVGELVRRMLAPWVPSAAATPRTVWVVARTTTTALLRGGAHAVRGPPLPAGT